MPENINHPALVNAGEAFLTPDFPTEYVIPDEARARIENTFTYHAPKGDQTKRYQELREKAKELAYMINAYVPSSREQSLALTKLEEVIFFANAGIARNE